MIYIVIVNWNGYKDTVDCIESLYSYIKVDYKIVIIDNGSDDNEGLSLREKFPKVKVINNRKNLGFCGGYNAGIKYCWEQRDCNYILVINNDVVTKDDFLVPLYRFCIKHKNAVVMPQVMNYNNPNKIQTLGGKIFLGGARHIRNASVAEFKKNKIVPNAISAVCMLASIDTYKEIGLFDENFFAYLEDVDWSIRANEKQHKLFTLLNSVIYHKHSRSTKGSMIKVKLIARNNIYIARKHYYGLKKIIFIINSILMGLILNIKYMSFKPVPYFINGIKEGLFKKIND